MKAFKKVADSLKNSPWVIPITLVFAGLFIISVVLMWEDYSTSLLGYQALPTRKANEWVEYFVAAIPQLGQVALVYIFADNTKKKWALLGGFIMWLVDSSLDIFYKANGMPPMVWLMAFFETTAIYSFGSEIMFTLSLGMLFQLAPHFARQFGDALAGISGGGTNGFIKFLQNMGVIDGKNSQLEDNEPHVETRGRKPKMSAFSEFNSEVER